MGLLSHGNLPNASGAQLHSGQKNYEPVSRFGWAIQPVGLYSAGGGTILAAANGSDPGLGASGSPSDHAGPPVSPPPSPQKNHKGWKVLAIILIVCGLLLSVTSILGGLIMTAAGCICQHHRARLLAKQAGEQPKPPYKQKWQIVVAALFIVLAAGGMLTPDPIDRIQVEGLVPSQLSVPDAQSLSFSYSPADASTDSVTCVSSDSAVASVEVVSAENGTIRCLVTPVSAGNVTITCSAEKAASPALDMTVTDPAAEEAERLAAEQAAKEEAERQAAEEAAQAEAERQAAEQAAAAQAAAEQQAASRTVYITPTGSRYHDSAKCAGKNAIETTLEQAKSQGYTPCKNCAGG